MADRYLNKPPTALYRSFPPGSEQVTDHLDNRCQTRPFETTDSAAQSAPTAPVSHRRAGPGPITLEASFTRHPGPQGATFGDPLRLLLAVWAARAAHTGRRCAKGAAGPLPPTLTKGGRRAMNVAAISDEEA